MKKKHLNSVSSAYTPCAYISVCKNLTNIKNTLNVCLPRANRLEKSVSSRVKRSLLSHDIWFLALSLKAPTMRLFSSKLLFFCRKPASLQHGEEWQNILSLESGCEGKLKLHCPTSCSTQATNSRFALWYLYLRLIPAVGVLLEQSYLWIGGGSKVLLYLWHQRTYGVCFWTM